VLSRRGVLLRTIRRAPVTTSISSFNHFRCASATYERRSIATARSVWVPVRTCPSIWWEFKAQDDCSGFGRVAEQKRRSFKPTRLTHNGQLSRLSPGYEGNIEPAPITSVLPLLADLLEFIRHVSKGANGLHPHH
jgi:hypothetical protein